MEATQVVQAAGRQRSAAANVFRISRVDGGWMVTEYPSRRHMEGHVGGFARGLLPTRSAAEAAAASMLPVLKRGA